MSPRDALKIEGAQTGCLKAQSKEQPLELGGVQIRQYTYGRYCLNDLHKAAGGERKHEPGAAKKLLREQLNAQREPLEASPAASRLYLRLPPRPLLRQLSCASNRSRSGLCETDRWRPIVA